MCQWTDSDLEDAYLRGFRDGCEQAETQMRSEIQHRLAETDKNMDELRARVEAAEAECERRKRAGLALLAKVRAVEAKFDRQQALDDAIAAERDPDAPPN